LKVQSGSSVACRSFSRQGLNLKMGQDQPKPS
jgi:hypothetical protein